MPLFGWNKLNQLIHMSKIKRNEYVVCEDISNGRERYCLPALSYCRNDQAPNDYHYVNEYVSLEPIQSPYVLLSELQCCNCLDDCSTSNCSCSLAGVSEHRVYNSKKHLSSSYNIDAPEVIRECNIGCRCKANQCNNMVIQNGCQARLALFRTKSRGWGVRTLEDLERGTFIGVYSGELISAANSHHRSDDTYLFNLTHAHILPKQEAASESAKKRENLEEEVQETFYEVDDDPNLSVSYSEATLASGLNSSDSIASHYTREESDRQLDQTSQLTNQPDQQQQQCPQQQQQQLEQFVCDAKYYGNFTRFINHSCEPNVVGIRSFTKHQDVRFPYIAFFTNKLIKAQTELTLNYGDNYWLVKCQRDKVFCLCKRTRCRFSKKSFPNTIEQHNSANRQ